MNLSSEIIWLLILIPLDFINLLISLLDKFLSIIETKLTKSLPMLEISIFVFGKFSPDEFSENSSGENLPDTKIDIPNMGFDIVNLVSVIDKKLSKSEIRRLIKSNGIKINNETISDDRFKISNELLKKNNFIKLSIGKKKHYKIVI